MEELTRNQADAKKLELGQITQSIKNLEKIQKLNNDRSGNLHRRINRIKNDANVKQQRANKKRTTTGTHSTIEGVKPEYDIRTDKWEVAAEAMDKLTQDKLQKRHEKNTKVVSINRTTNTNTSDGQTADKHGKE